MSIRTKVLGLVDVMMRVPPILIIDQILKSNMGIPTKIYEEANISNNTGNSTLEMVIDNATGTAAANGVLSNSFGNLVEELVRNSDISEMLSIATMKFIICFLGLLCATCIFLLWTKHLVMVYMFVISIGLTFLSYWSNVSALAVMQKSPPLMESILLLNTNRLLDAGSLILSIIPHMISEWFMGMLFAYIHMGPRYEFLQRSMPFIFVGPILIALLPISPRITTHVPVVSSIIPLFLTKATLLGNAMEVAKTVYKGYQYTLNFISNFGLSALIENEWQRLNVPSVLRVFWTIRISQAFIGVFYAEVITTENILQILQKLLVDGCETLTAVLGMTAVVSVICHYIGKGFQWYLMTMDNDQEKSLGTVSAVLFYILALQTGLTSLDPEKRFERLCRNVCLLLTALLHFLHNIVSPILMSLSAARNPSWKRHMRALSVCLFLIITPISLLIMLWTRHTLSTWLLAATAFSIEVIVKVLVSLATYTLFLLDARRQSFWEKLDDYLYYVRAFGNTVEFCFGILLLFNGAWILIFESGGAIRAFMMCIHAYFNIWCEARAGWSVFMKRRMAVHKISSLPEATPAQLRAFDDVCAICYQVMYTAKITRCRHIFHGICLRKWLYVQDRCPLCHEIMMYTEKSDEDTTRANASPPIPIFPRDDESGNRRSSEPLGLSLNQINQTPASSMPILGNASTSSSDHVSVTNASSNSTVSPAATDTVMTAAVSNTAHSFRLSHGLENHE